MLQKNQKKLENKKRRGIWSCARPVTQVVPNRKKQTRQQNKQELRRRIREDSNLLYFIRIVNIFREVVIKDVYNGEKYTYRYGRIRSRNN